MAIFRGTGSASATADQTTIDTVTQAVTDAEAAQTAAEAAQTAAETAKTDAQNLYGDLAAVSTAKTDAETAATTATTKASEASDDAADAQKLALNPVDSQFTLSDGSTTGYSALHYNTQTQLRYDNFDDRYLGSKDVAPTVDNDGDPLITGAMYFDNDDSLMYVWTENDEWVNVTPSSQISLSQVTDVTSNATEVNVLDVSVQTPSDGNVLTYNTVGGLNWATPSTETNDLTASVTWANVPDANITQTSVTQHQAALSITESQISDLQSYLTSIPDNYILNTGDAITGDLSFGDNNKAIFGAGPDLQIYHDGSNSYISEPTGTGNLKIQATNLNIQRHDGTETYIDCTSNGDVTLYHNGNAKIATTTSGIDVTGRATGTLTTDNDLSFDMNASNQFKCTPTGNGTLTFTNITSGQSGNVWLDNSGGHTISAAATTYISSADLTTISAAGVYFMSYYSDGTNVMVSATPAVTSAGA